MLIRGVLTIVSDLKDLWVLNCVLNMAEKSNYVQKNFHAECPLQPVVFLIGSPYVNMQ